jgi:hypothetical protein
MAFSHNSFNIRQLYNTYIVLASEPLDVLEYYRNLVAAAKPAQIVLVPLSAFDPEHALCPYNRCADIIFEMNDALVLRLNQTGMLNLDDETINIVYQKHIIDSSSGVRAYECLHALLKKAKCQLNDKMPIPPDIDKATSIGLCCANLERYCLQIQTIILSLLVGSDVSFAPVVQQTA